MDEYRIQDGARLEIKFQRKVSTNPDFKLFSIYEETLPDGRILITTPIWKSALYPIIHGTQISISFFRNTSLFRFEAVAEERIKKGNIDFTAIRAVTPITKIQRRNHFRLEVNMKALLVNYYFGKGNKKKVKDEIRIVNISGGGVNARLNEPMEVGQKVGLILCEIEGVDQIEIECEVRRVEEIKTDGAYKYSVGLMYKVVNTDVQEKIIHFIFEEQRRLLSRHHT